MTTQTVTETSLSIKRVFNAPRERVYKAFVDRDELAKWYAPGTMRPEVHELVPELGGAFRISMTMTEGDDAGQTHGAFGKFTEIVPNERLVHTWNWENPEHTGGTESRITVEFKDVDDGTEVTLTHEELPNKESVQSHTEGWIGCLENLAKAL